MPPACGVADPLALFGQGEFLRAIFCTFGDVVSIAGLVLVTWFTVSAMSYVRTKSVVMPIVLLLLMGGATLPLLPPAGLRVAAFVLVGGAAGISVLALRRVDQI